MSKKKKIPRGPIANIWKNKGLNPFKSRSQFKNMLFLVNFTQSAGKIGLRQKDALKSKLRIAGDTFLPKMKREKSQVTKV